VGRLPFEKNISDLVVLRCCEEKKIIAEISTAGVLSANNQGNTQEISGESLSSLEVNAFPVGLLKDSLDSQANHFQIDQGRDSRPP